jgi:lambda repressor-like predicted transcriptional regulator
MSLVWKGRTLANADIRAEMKEKGVTLWEMAEALNIHNNTLSHKFRREMNEAEKGEAIALIAKIAAQHEGA